MSDGLGFAQDGAGGTGSQSRTIGRHRDEDGQLFIDEEEEEEVEADDDDDNDDDDDDDDDVETAGTLSRMRSTANRTSAIVSCWHID